MIRMISFLLITNLRISFQWKVNYWNLLFFIRFFEMSLVEIYCIYVKQHVGRLLLFYFRPYNSPHVSYFIFFTHCIVRLCQPIFIWTKNWLRSPKLFVFVQTTTKMALFLFDLDNRSMGFAVSLCMYMSVWVRKTKSKCMYMKNAVRSSKSQSMYTKIGVRCTIPI